MAALPTSMRRTMLMLLVASSMIIFVFYWNQTSLKPISYASRFFMRSSMPGRNNPSERSWTYKCNGEKCIREHYLSAAGVRRIPFMSCAMVCGSSPNIWPLPTGQSKFSRRSLTMRSDLLSLHVDTKFKEVDLLFRQAFNIFVTDLQTLEGSLVSVDRSSVSNGQVDTNDQSSGGDDRKFDSHRSTVEEGSTEILKKNCDIKRFNVSVAVSDSAAVHLTIDTDESYEMTMQNENDMTTVRIHAKTFFGARHGLASLQQLIWYDDEDEQLRIMSTATIQDQPKFRYRGLMLDTSRNYFSVASIKRTLVGMAHTKLNRFHWHITDSQSFPYVSKHYPQMAEYGAYSSHEIYTESDVREVADFARVRGIQVIPEIDAPAHAGNGWDWGPKHGLGELSLCINQQPWSYYCGEPPCGQLNPKNNNTYLILQKLYTELLELTGPTDYFHLGGDEVNLECWSQYFNDTDIRSLWCDFMLQAYARLKIANGNVAPRMVSVWSSGLTNTACLSKNNFSVQVWGGSTWAENYELITNGYSIVISHVDYWYLDCGFGSWRSVGDGACSPYTTWQKVYSHRPWDQAHMDDIKMKQILGGEACLWTEQVDENALDTRLWPRTAAIAERLWTDPLENQETDVVPKEVFNRMSVLRNRLVDWGIGAEAIFPKFCSQSQQECL